jgi:hypothetical protein
VIPFLFILAQGWEKSTHRYIPSKQLIGLTLLERVCLESTRTPQ